MEAAHFLFWTLKYCGKPILPIVLWVDYCFAHQSLRCALESKFFGTVWGLFVFWVEGALRQFKKDSLKLGGWWMAICNKARCWCQGMWMWGGCKFCAKPRRQGPVPKCQWELRLMPISSLRHHEFEMAWTWVEDRQFAKNSILMLRDVWEGC